MAMAVGLTDLNALAARVTVRDISDAAYLANQTLAVLQSTVDALTTPQGGRYIVGPAGGTTAATSLRDKQVWVTMKPLTDLYGGYGYRVAGGEVFKAVNVLAGLTLHEVGHARYDEPFVKAEEVRFPAGPANVATLSNLLGDVRNERTLVWEYAGWRGVFKPALDWMWEAGRSNARDVNDDLRGIGITSPITFAINAVRYDGYGEWLDDAVTTAERAWWQDWAERYAFVGVTPEQHCDGIAEAIEHLREMPRPPKGGGGEKPRGPKPPKPEGPVGPGGDPGEDEGGDEPGGDEPGGDEGGEEPKGEGKGEGEGPKGEQPGGNEPGGEDTDEPGTYEEPEPVDPADEKPEAPSCGHGPGGSETPDEESERKARQLVNSMKYDAATPRVDEAEHGRMTIDWR